MFDTHFFKDIKISDSDIKLMTFLQNLIKINIVHYSWIENFLIQSFLFANYFLSMFSVKDFFIFNLHFDYL